MTYSDQRESGFSHGSDAGLRAPGAVSSTTRYLGGAAYVDEKYAEQVVDELVAHSHRAVAPSLGYDVTTVVRHCFRAQRLWLAQNAVLVTVLVIGLILFTGAAVTIYLIALIVMFFTRETPPEKRRPVWQVAALVIVGLAVVGCLGGPLAVFLLGGLRDTSGFGADALETSAYDFSLGRFVGGLLVVGLALFGTIGWSRHRMITTINSELGRGRQVSRPSAERPEVEQRIRTIGVAQHGNVVLHSGFEPFVGAGRPTNAWSIATELRPEEEPAGNGNGRVRGTVADAVPSRVRIDPVELVDHLRRRLAALRSHDLAPHERITGLQLRDQVVASGTKWYDYPLIDERVRLPYAYAETDAVEAIIRSPQTSARHFLRVSVGAPERAATDTDGRTIMPAEHQSVVGSTYLHVAVEGGLLYMEVVTTLLGPIQQRYLDIDRYEAADRVQVALREAVSRAGHDIAVAPARLVHGLSRLATLAGRIHRADRDAAAEPVFDFGARFDVRQAAATPRPATYLQHLDAEKYARLIDRRATEAIVEFLTAKGVDTSDFVAKVNFYQSNHTSIQANYGPVATGPNASAAMTGMLAATAGGAQGKGKAS